MREREREKARARQGEGERERERERERARERTEQQKHASQTCFLSSTPQLPFKIPQIPCNRDHHKALNRGTLGGLGFFLGVASCSLHEETSLQHQGP